jgi:hypothetical protein
MSNVNNKTITIENIFSEYPKAPAPLKKQYEFLFNLYSVPLECPHCRGYHKYAAVKLNGEKCPETDKQLERKVTLFGEQFFEGK